MVSPKCFKLLFYLLFIQLLFSRLLSRTNSTDEFSIDAPSNEEREIMSYLIHIIAQL